MRTLHTIKNAAVAILVAIAPVFFCLSCAESDNLSLNDLKNADSQLQTRSQVEDSECYFYDQDKIKIFLKPVAQTALSRSSLSSSFSNYYSDQYGNVIALSDYFYVKLKETKQALKDLEEMVKTYHCVVVSQDEYMPLWYKIQVTESTGLNALACSNLFYESGLFAAAEPDLNADIHQSNDPYSFRQWGVDRIYLPDAWEITTGSDVVVAVVDQGIELSHPDLTSHILSTSYDCEAGVSPQRVRGNHGTSVAGIIGAIKENAIGITGVAPDCRIMSVSHSLETADGSEREQLARGINWAAQHGADVINCSWGHATALSGSYITDAINQVTGVWGRRGKGCVVVCSSGNESLSSVIFPTSLASTIAVGSVNPSDLRSTFSNYGYSLDVVAPGEGIYTTDRTGYGYGYDLYSDYCSFDGTSAAAPFVSGVAALILSNNPNLTSKEVGDIIRKNCQWLPSYTGLNTILQRKWNQEIGYGLVDANQALLNPTVEAEPITTGVDFTIINKTGLDVSDIYVELTGYVDGVYNTLVSYDPGAVSAHSTMQGPVSEPAISITAIPNA